MAAGDLYVAGTTEMAGGAKDTTLITNLNADQVDGADKDTDGTLAANSDAKVPSQKAVKTYADTCVKLTGDQTIAGKKTFSDGIDSGGNGTILKFKVINIGDWNMDLTDSLNVAHGLADHTKIRSVSVIIRDDTNTIYNNLYKVSDTADPQYTEGGISAMGATNLILRRTIGGAFNSTSYDSTSYNRGWITVWYEA